MKTKFRNRMALPATGASTLMVALAVVCIVIFALTSLSTVQADKRLSEAAMNAATAYYNADLEAERVFARLRAGENVPGVQKQGGLYTYSCPISENQMLYVEIEETDSLWRVLRWQSVVQQNKTDEILPVWNGA